MPVRTSAVMGTSLLTDRSFGVRTAATLDTQAVDGGRDQGFREANEDC